MRIEIFFIVLLLSTLVPACNEQHCRTGVSIASGVCGTIASVGGAATAGAVCAETAWFTLGLSCTVAGNAYAAVAGGCAVGGIREACASCANDDEVNSFDKVLDKLDQMEQNNLEQGLNNEQWFNRLSADNKQLIRGQTQMIQLQRDMMRRFDTFVTSIEDLGHKVERTQLMALYGHDLNTIENAQNKFLRLPRGKLNTIKATQDQLDNFINHALDHSSGLENAIDNIFLMINGGHFLKPESLYSAESGRFCKLEVQEFLFKVLMEAYTLYSVALAMQGRAPTPQFTSDFRKNAEQAKIAYAMHCQCPEGMKNVTVGHITRLFSNLPTTIKSNETNRLEAAWLDDRSFRLKLFIIQKVVNVEAHERTFDVLRDIPVEAVELAVTKLKLGHLMDLEVLNDQPMCVSIKDNAVTQSFACNGKKRVNSGDLATLFSRLPKSIKSNETNLVEAAGHPDRSFRLKLVTLQQVINVEANNDTFNILRDIPVEAINIAVTKYKQGKLNDLSVLGNQTMCVSIEDNLNHQDLDLKVCEESKIIEGDKYKAGFKKLSVDGETRKAICDENGGNLNINIMVAIGWKSGTIHYTEVINTDTLTSCSNLPAKYPHKVRLAVVMKHNSKMIICGGYEEIRYRSTSDCYSYSDNRWTKEAFKLEPVRWGAMSVEIRPGEWLVMGGWNKRLKYLKDRKLFKNGTFIQGPELPEPILEGSSVMLNQTHLFVAAGKYQLTSFSPRNYLFDINTEQWTQIADRTLAPSYAHSSGIFFNSTANEVQVANIGVKGIEVYSPNGNSWHQLPFPSQLTGLSYSTAIQLGTYSFMLIGGITNLDDPSGAIYSFDQNGLSIFKENVLKVPREQHVAMPISKDDFTCNFNK